MTDETKQEDPGTPLGHNSGDTLPSVDQLVEALAAKNEEALTHTAALLKRGEDFLVINNDDEDAAATEFMVKVRARWKDAEATRVAEKAPWDERAGAIHAFFKTRILDLLGHAPANKDQAFDPVESTQYGIGPRVNMAQTLYKRRKVEAERRQREKEAREAREREDEARRKREAAEAEAREQERKAREERDRKQREAEAAAKAAADAAARKRNAENKAAADAAAAAAAKLAEDARKRREEEDAAEQRAKDKRAEEARAEENRLAEERAALEEAANASSAEISRNRGGKGGVSSLRTRIAVRDIDREALDYQKLGPYFKDEHIKMALKAYHAANKAVVENGIKNGQQPIAGVVFYHSDTNAGRA